MHNVHYKHIANIPGIISQKYNMYNKPILHLSHLDTMSHRFGVLSGIWLAAKRKAFNSDNLRTTSFLAFYVVS